MSAYITRPSDYWIAPNAVTITLNALGEANRIQGSVASGAVISCYVADIVPGGENGDGLQLDNGRNPKRWPLSLSPTYFNSDTPKYVYAAIPRSTAIGSLAVIVFPSQKLDIYGRTEVTVPGDSVAGEQGEAEPTYEQIGSADYFYIFLQGIIAAPSNGARRWTTDIDYGSLGTYEDLIKVNDSDWYRWDPLTQIVTLLKNIAMSDDSTFINLKAQIATIANTLTLHGDRLTGTAKTATVLDGSPVEPTPASSTDTIVTPAYLDEFGNTRYLSKVHDDTAAGKITFQDIATFVQGLKLGSSDSRYGITGSGSATLLDIIFDHVLKSKDARKGFTDGHGIYMDALEGLIETDGMNVRGFMRVMELIINRLQLMESDYSFTEGDTVEHIDYEDNGQTLVLTMHRDHPNDYTPFYPGDIIYGIVNDLLPKDAPVPDGHSTTRNASYYKTWMRVKSVDLNDNKIRVALYQGKRYAGTDPTTGDAIYEPIVPGGTNFSPYGTAITTDVTAPMLAEYNTVPVGSPDGATLGASGYDTMLTITRHGNVADGIDPDTGLPDEHILQSQMGRQQAWVLSTTDKRLSFFWNVDAPIIRDENYALCLGMLPDLANLPSTRNKAMPSLYVNTVFADHFDPANYPARVVKEDRGQWAQPATVEYTSQYEGTYTPDGTLTATDPDLSALGGYVAQIPTYAGTYHTGDVITEPYHFRTFTKQQWLQHRLDTAHYRTLSDKQLLLKMLLEWRESVDLEVSRVWNHGALWECLVDGTQQEPWFTSTDWMFVSGGTFSLGFFSSEVSPVPIVGIQVRPSHIDETIVPFLLFGQEDATSLVTSWRWERESNKEALDEAWKNSARTDPDDPTSPLKSQTRTLHLTTADLPTGWDADGGRVGFRCTATFLMDGEETEIINNITII